MEYSCMSERILRQIESVIKQDLELIDVTIVPTDDNSRNKSPVLLQEHHLGLESWCVKYVYQYACSELFKTRKILSEKKMGHSKMENLNYLLVGALLINPDVGTFWNMRRELVECDILDYEGEFRFSKLVLTRKGKSYEAFCYRRWLLRRIMDKLLMNQMSPPVMLLDAELSVALATAQNSQNNYHSWTHRLWCNENLGPYCPSVLEEELSFSEKWINEHVSEYSGYHYRQYVLSLCAKRETGTILRHYCDRVLQHLNLVCDVDFNQLLTYFLGEQSKNSKLEVTYRFMNYLFLLLYEVLVVIPCINKSFPEHESLWLHRRFVVSSLVRLAYSFHSSSVKVPRKDSVSSKCAKNFVQCFSASDSGEKMPKMFKSQPCRVETSNLYKCLLETEKMFINESCNTADYGKRHQKWLKFVLGIELT
ncbi:protein prenyltransferase alpha subunit repeat-containing protein 1 [Cylas formicarius]|uniref:protein prenyltransferase alpha subunit repeat-containing protein 1 n=1 Tax=Cylas formicarius TaxID=197179 RepID=UPI002958760B|nr:protein prenyltransferase alpha subunit repeat-containing protein 1 [Cylas formicarius]